MEKQIENLDDGISLNQLLDFVKKYCNFKKGWFYGIRIFLRKM